MFAACSEDPRLNSMAPPALSSGLDLCGRPDPPARTGPRAPTSPRLYRASMPTVSGQRRHQDRVDREGAPVPPGANATPLFAWGTRLTCPQPSPQPPTSSALREALSVPQIARALSSEPVDRRGVSRLQPRAPAKRPRTRCGSSSPPPPSPSPSARPRRRRERCPSTDEHSSLLAKTSCSVCLPLAAPRPTNAPDPAPPQVRRRRELRGRRGQLLLVLPGLGLRGFGRRGRHDERAA
eukprot:COSAG04_NODE_8376_length_984_cov_0.959322_2_plen_236_part_01